MKTRVSKFCVVLTICILFWFLTAPANMALERLISGGNSTSATRAVDCAIDAYSGPLVLLKEYSAFRAASDNLSDFWCEVLGAPETTP